MDSMRRPRRRIYWNGHSTSPRYADTKALGEAMAKFLESDLGTLARWYAQEAQGAAGVPYVHLKQWSVRDDSAAVAPVSVRVLPQRFDIQRNRPIGWLDVTERAMAALAERGDDLSRSEKLIRIPAFDPVTSVMSVQQAEYNDQRRSNLVLDFSVSGLPTLREMLRAEFGAVLPPLDDPRLANTLGIAMLVVVNFNGRLCGYCVRRAKRGVAVFQDTWACTASGAAKWPKRDDADSFWAGVCSDMLEELDEEVGLKDEDLGLFMPVAFSRELHRGGKPQLFFLATCSLSAEELRSRRRKARRIAQALRMPLEVEPDTWLKSAAQFVDLRNDLSLRQGKDWSHEATALLVEAARQYADIGRAFPG
jgi:hypothetical protein